MCDSFTLKHQYFFRFNTNFCSTIKKHNLFFDINKNEIRFIKEFDKTESWLDSMGIENYTINDELIVNVSGSVWLSDKDLDYIPVQFGVVNGDFNCSKNNLTSLEGCPTKVGGIFSCLDNNLTSLKGCPTKVGGTFACFNNNLTSLERCPTKVGGYFNCYNNKLTSLEHCPTKVGGSFDCSHNNLTSLEHCPTKVYKSFDCSHNNLISLEHCPIEVGGYSNCENNIIISEIPKGYFGKDNPSWKTDDLELISSRFFDKLEVLDSDTKIRVLTDLKKLEPEFYNSVPFQAYKPDSMLGCIQRSREATGGLFEL